MTLKALITRRLKYGGLWASGGKILFTLGTLAWNILLTRILNEAEVGAFYLIASVVVFGELIILGGMNQAVMRLISTSSVSHENVRPVIKGTAFLVGLFALTGGLLYFWAIGPYIGQQVFHSRLVSELVGLTTAWFILRAIQTYLAFILRGFHRVGIAAFVDGASTAIFITLALGYLWFNPDHTGIRDVLFIVIGALVSTAVLALLLVKNSYRRSEQTIGLSLMEPIRIGLPLSILALSGIGINEAHLWIAGAFVSHVDVAIYGAASRLAKFIQMPLLIINGVIPSTIAQLSSVNDKPRIEKVLQAAALTAALPSLIIALIVFIASKEILGFVFGSTYATGSSVLMILIFGQTISVMVGSPGVFMAMTDRQTVLMFMGICAGLVGIGCSLLLVDRHGILGIALGTAMGKALYNISMWAYCLKALGIKTHASPLALANIREALKQ